MNNKNITKVVFGGVYFLIFGAVGLLLFAFIGAELGFSPAIKIANYISEKLDIVVSGTTIAALLAGVRYMATIKNKSDLSIADITNVKNAIVGTNKDLIKTEEKIAEAINEFKETTVCVKTMADEMTAMRKERAEEKELLSTILDIQFAYVLKNSGDPTIKNIKMAYEQSELMKKVMALQKLEDRPDIIPETKKEIQQIIQVAKDEIKAAKKRVML